MNDIQKIFTIKNGLKLENLIKNIEKSKNQIVNDWTDKVISEIAIYKNEPRVLIKKNISTNIECILKYLDGNVNPTDNFINDIALLRVKSRFRIEDVTKAVFLGRDVIFNLIFTFEVIDRDFPYYLKEIDNWFFYTIITHGEVHSKLLQEKYEEIDPKIEQLFQYFHEIRKVVSNL